MKKRIIAIIVLCTAIFTSSANATNMDKPKLSRDDEAFLEEIEHQAFNYFWEEANPDTGIVYDSNTKRMGGSISSVGFALSAICVADSRGWVSHDEAYKRVLATLKSFHKNPDNSGDFCVDGYCGAFFHYIDTETGKWYKNSDCVSTADTADLIAGVITCMEYFKGTEIERLGDDIVRLCEWDSFLKDNKAGEHKFIAMGCVPPGMKSLWTQESGFFGRYYGYMDNSFLIYLLALASPTHPIDQSSWYACQATYKHQAYDGRTVIVPNPPGLAFHYYQHCWLDLRNKKDQAADYFKNSLLAVRAQQEYCAASGRYKDGLWGISSSMSPRGYEAMGAPFADAYENGTITPHAIAGGLVFTPKASLDTLKYLAAYYGNMVLGRFGFTDAFNEEKSWASRDYIGIDEGVIVLMIENYRTGLIWKYFTRNKYISGAMKKIGFVGVVEDFENDAGGGYSKYGIPGANATGKVSSDSAMEGKRSLRLDSINGKMVTLKIRPDMKDFSGFKYISLWARNSKNTRISISDAKNDAATLDYSSYLDSAGWRRYFYSLDRTDGVSLENITEVTVTVMPESDNIHQPVYLDGIELTYSTCESNPPKVNGIKLSALNDLSICNVSFDAAVGAHNYDIRYSAAPINNQADFEKACPVNKTFFASSNDREEFFVPLPAAGQYYIGVQAVDKMGQRSSVMSAGLVTITGHSPVETLDDFEAPGLQSGPIMWPPRKSFVMTISGERSSHGKRSLKAQFNKASADEWDCIELDFKEPIDLRPFNYLTFDVFGEDAVLAKLYSSKNSQQDIGTLRPLKKNAWNELRFEIAAIPEDNVDKSHITKIFLFPDPGRSSSGTIYIDNIRLNN